VDSLTNQPSRTRVDIQVLRAAAVLAVILGHFWPDRLPGGFTGVDVFFVISGFLITSQILSEVQRSSRLNLVAFWMRRIRRIFPAAVSVIAAVAITVLWIGSPDQLDILTRHVTASALSAENLLLSWDAVDYNHQGDTTSPLQHFWSLAVEEQFYLVWPLLVALGLALTRISQLPMARFLRILLLAICALTIASFVYSTSLDHTNPATYYDPLARAWELGVGAAIAVIGTTELARISARTRQLASLGASIVIIGVTFVPGLENAVPGLGVLPSVIGTGIVIIAAAPMTTFRFPIVARAVSGLRWLGDRSYSAYLWHWPILIMAPTVIGADLTFFPKVTALGLIVVVSALSFRFIEQPFRSTTAAVIRRPIFLATISASLTVLLIVGTTVATDNATKGLDAASAANLIPTPSVPSTDIVTPTHPPVQPFCDGAGAAVFECPPSTEVLFDTFSLPSFPPETPTCVPLINENYFDCILGDVNAPNAVVVVGDSHAKALWVAWDDVGKRLGVAVHAFFLNACPFVVGRGGLCTKRNDIVRNRLLAGEFAFAILVQSVDHPRRIPDPTERADFEATYSDLASHGVRFVVVKDNPGVGENERNCVNYNRDDASGCVMSRGKGFEFDDYAFDVAQELGLDTIDFSEIYCDHSTCPLVIGGVSVYRDSRHITAIFGKTLGPFLFDELATLGFTTLID
jgi:peptidoglycan/LPS O-acetylase OafA/YrhL